MRYFKMQISDYTYVLPNVNIFKLHLQSCDSQINVQNNRFLTMSNFEHRDLSPKYNFVYSIRLTNY